MHLLDFDEEGPFEVGIAVITVLREDTPSLRALVDHVLSVPSCYDLEELRDRAGAYECLEREEEEARMQDIFRQLSYGNDYMPSMYA